jgi:hypothetical protein
MEKERNLGVTEARFALTLLTCLLVAIGYVALLRLGGSKDTTVEPGSDNIPPPGIAGPETPIQTEPQPIVLPLEKPEDGHSEPTSKLARRPSTVQQPPDPERR